VLCSSGQCCFVFCSVVHIVVLVCRAAVVVFGLCSCFCKLAAVGGRDGLAASVVLAASDLVECVVHCNSLYIEIWWELVECCMGVWDVGGGLLPVWHLLDELNGGLVWCYCGDRLVIWICCIGRWFAVGCWEFFITVVIGQSIVDCILGDGPLSNFLVKKGVCKVNCQLAAWVIQV